MKNMMLFTFLLIFLACGRARENKTHREQQGDLFIVERDLFFNSLHRVDEVKTILTDAGRSFDSTLLHQPAMKINYMGNDVRAASNLGIYLADLNYCILFNRRETGKSFLNAVFELSEVIQIEKSILEYLMKRYETNLQQNDSLHAVVQQLFEQSTLKLKDTDRERLAGIVMAGYEIENLYLALSTIQSFPADISAEQQKARDILIDYVLQKQNQIEVIYNFVKIHADPLDPDKNPNYPFFDSALRDLIGVYRTLNSQSSFQELTERVTVIRSKIITG